MAESLVYARVANDPAETGLVLFHLGVVAWGQGDSERADGLLHEALDVQRAAGDLAYGAAESLGFLGRFACEQGDLPRSVDLQRESLSLHLEMVSQEVGRSAWPTWRCWPWPPGGRWRRRASSRRPSGSGRQSATRSSCRSARLRPSDRRREGGGARRGLRGGLGRRTRSVSDGGGRRSFRRARRDRGPEATAGAPASRPAPTAPKTLAGLTAREREVLRLLIAGRTDREIAEALFISPRTAHGHVANIFAKLDVSTRTAAVSPPRSRPASFPV